MKRIAIASCVAACLVLGVTALQAQYYPQQNPPQQNYPPPQNYPAQQYPVQQQPYYNQVNTIPAGTNIAIRTNQAIVAKQAQPGASYSAEIAQNVAGPDGSVIIPAGSAAMLMVVNTGKSILGGSEVGLALQSVTVNGRNYMIATNTQRGASSSGIGANKRTAEYVGGGAVLGTLVGAVAGGGKGAAIGAVLGGAGGAATQVLTRGNQINVPAESVLTFKLDQPIQLQ